MSDLSWVKGEYQSLYGSVRTEWIREKEKFVVYKKIPGITTSGIFLPTDKVINITENGKTLINNHEFTSISSENGETVIETGSGRYAFAIKINR